MSKRPRNASNAGTGPRPVFRVVHSTRIANEDNLIASLGSPAGDRKKLSKAERES